MKTSATQKPLPHPFYGDSYERGSDPWNKEAFPPELAYAAPNQGMRSEGWFLVDGFGNAIGFIADGTDIGEMSASESVGGGGGSENLPAALEKSNGKLSDAGGKP